MVDRILVPTDGSNGSRRAAERAIEIAATDGAVIHALHVVNMQDIGFAAIPDDLAETRGHLERKGTEYVEEIVDMGETAGVEVLTAIEAGIPEDVIVEYVTDSDVDLVVMGKRGRSGIDRLLVGSTTNRVIGSTDVPVQVV